MTDFTVFLIIEHWYSLNLNSDISPQRILAFSITTDVHTQSDGRLTCVRDKLFMCAAILTTVRTVAHTENVQCTAYALYSVRTAAQYRMQQEAKQNSQTAHSMNNKHNGSYLLCHFFACILIMQKKS